VKRRLGGWSEMAESVVRNAGSWKIAPVQRKSRGTAILKSRYQATTSVDLRAGKERDFVKCGNSDSVIVICSYDL
jgi:hypothetical protein